MEPKITDFEDIVIDKLSNIEDLLIQIKSKEPAINKKYYLIDDWKKKIQKTCEHKKYVGLEECEHSCKLINNVCNMPNCPKNVKE